MQKFKLLLLAVLSVSTLIVSAQTKSETVKVWGNCGMCQSRIEKAAKAAGATTAKWDVDMHVLTVSYDTATTSLSVIEEKIASVGHDTQNKTAPKEAYDKLPGCCQYERKEASVSAVSCCKSDAPCCDPSQTCCTPSAAALMVTAANCCVNSGACCDAGQDCCAKAAIATIIADDCCTPGSACCTAGAACCSNIAEAATASTGDCCEAGASCCEGGEVCCAQVSAVA
jgi:periplasmic mercuric ion binding protein